MKYVLLTILFLSQFDNAQAAEPFRIRVLSYNIHHAAGTDRKLDLQRITNVIKSVNPDIVALQEVDKKVGRSKRVDQPAELAKLTGMNVVFEKNIAFDGGEYGNAALSKFAITKHRNVHLPRFDDSEQRGVLICQLRPKSLSMPLYFMATHLDHRRPNRERLASAKQIDELVGDYSDGPAILAGDLNDTPASDVLKQFQTQWRIHVDGQTSAKQFNTVPSGKPNRQIDFVLTRRTHSWKTIELKVLDEPVASDHRPIFAVLELQESSERTQFASEIKCQGDYQHHLQGVCVGANDELVWSFTTQLVRTDSSGQVLKSVPAANHHGDVCFANGKLYVAVNLGRFNDPKGNADSWVYEYDAKTLRLLARHETQQVFHGAGGIAFSKGHFFVVGGLPENVQENYVYEYDEKFVFIKRHVLKSGWTRLGIQTATFHDNQWWFGCYGNPAIMLVADRDFKTVKRHEFDCSLGIVGVAKGRLLVAKGPRTKSGRCLGSLHLATPSAETGLSFKPAP